VCSSDLDVERPDQLEDLGAAGVDRVGLHGAEGYPRRTTATVTVE